MTRKRPPKRLEDMRQPPLFETAPDTTAAPPAPTPSVTDAAFRCGDRRKLFVGHTPLRAYLSASGQGLYLRVADQIDRVDVTELLRTYSPLGRHALHPRILLGLILFGILVGKSSLRELEQLAVCDVRAWWICRGEQPDHSTIGKFIVAHAAWLEGAGFGAALAQALRGLGLKPGEAAIDGTVVEAAASRLNMLKKDAARAAAEDAARVAAERPEDRRAQRAAARAQKVADAAAKRTEARAAKGRPADQLRVAASDPDAVTQPRKDDVVRPSYKPSILTHREQLILGHHVDASCETAAVAPLLQQHERALGALPTTLLADAGYFALSVLELAADRTLDLLCPSGKATGAHDVERTRRGAFGKHLFVYQPDGTYRCPAGETLVALRRDRERDGRELTKFGGAACGACALRARCTDARDGRTLKRYDGDELKDAMREVMNQPAARAKYRERSGMVEPVFARLQRLGLRRFRRRGLDRVRAEFALYCMAYNFRRADGVREARLAAGVLLRVHGAPVVIVLWYAILVNPGRR